MARILDSTYPEQWQSLYHKRLYYFIDPVLLYSVRKTGDYRFDNIKGTKGSTMMRYVADHGLKFGATFSRIEGFSPSVLTVSRDGRDLTESEVEYLSRYFDSLVVRVKNSQLLAPNEKEVLRHLLVENSLNDVAKKLGISSSAAKQRANRARKKLSCRANVQAVASAMQRNLL